MKFRLINENAQYKILSSDGQIFSSTKDNLNTLLTSFKFVNELGSTVGMWNREYPDITAYPGETCAYVTDNDNLVIQDFSPFKIIFEQNSEITNLINVSEYATMHGKSIEQIKVFCRKGRISGATKIGRDWVIPADAPYPQDNRITHGKYLLANK